MKKVSNIILGIIIILFIPLSSVIAEKNNHFFYWYFTVVIIYLYIIMKKNRKLIGFISFSLLSLSLIISLLNFSELSKIISDFSFIGVVAFLICEYISEKTKNGK